ncbi:hypothetical protein, partial [Azovibrio restrictus]|uniref:hypothetical protein n=1 Tax=Azovibrio restrictus TaxID=146938 RepID=UPI0026E92A1D
SGATVEYLVPDRFTLGYGLSPAIVDLAAERQPDLIITVDNGIISLSFSARIHDPTRPPPRPQQTPVATGTAGPASPSGPALRRPGSE